MNALSCLISVQLRFVKLTNENSFGLFNKWKIIFFWAKWFIAFLSRLKNPKIVKFDCRILYWKETFWRTAFSSTFWCRDPAPILGHLQNRYEHSSSLFGTRHAPNNGLKSRDLDFIFEEIRYWSVHNWGHPDCLIYRNPGYYRHKTDPFEQVRAEKKFAVRELIQLLCTHKRRLQIRLGIVSWTQKDLVTNILGDQCFERFVETAHCCGVLWWWSIGKRLMQNSKVETHFV